MKFAKNPLSQENSLLYWKTHQYYKVKKRNKDEMVRISDGGILSIENSNKSITRLLKLISEFYKVNVGKN